MDSGTPVGAISYIDHKSKTIGFFGYGLYIGRSVPDDNVICNYVRVSSTGVESDAMCLQSGRKLYRCECELWAPNMEIWRYLRECQADGWTIISVDIRKYRKKAMRLFENSLFRNLS